MKMFYAAGFFMIIIGALGISLCEKIADFFCVSVYWLDLLIFANIEIVGIFIIILTKFSKNYQKRYLEKGIVTIYATEVI